MLYFLTETLLMLFNWYNLISFRGGRVMIRYATENDLVYILDIYNDAIVNTTTVYTYDETDLDERKVWFENKRNDSLPIIVFERDNRVVGFATYGPFRNWPAYQYTVEHSIYVDPRYKRLGIASALLDEVISLATEAGYKTMVAGIDDSNEGSVALHKKKGFNHVGTLSNVGFKFDKWLTLVFYQLMLK